MVALESSRLFGGLPQPELLQLQKLAQIQTYRPNQVIFKEGDVGDGMYVIQSGSVQISSLINNEERRTLSNLWPGDFFGEMAVIDNAPRSATASAREETNVYFLPSKEVQRLLETSPKLAVSLTKEFSARIREFNRRYIEETLNAERLSMVGRFARTIVHDFKNPLNVIGIAAELGGMEAATPEMRKVAAQRIRKQVDRLSNMINELLEFTRGSQSSVVLAPANFALFVEHLIEELEGEVRDASVTLECRNSPPEVCLLFDPQRLTHVFYNLVHNAVDAMPNGGKIYFDFKIENGELLTSIHDTGKGIAPEIVSRLFEAFATFGKAQGSGLGLSICKRIIEDHRGTIMARNDPQGGAVFTFSLPLSRS
jgi:signal transduction histidine kinase